VEAERALALARREGADTEALAGDRLMAAEARLQSAIIDFATGEHTHGDPISLALGMLRLAEEELFEDPPDLRAKSGEGDRRRGDRRHSARQEN
jgi:hypothetical protein